ncbi:AAA family ATPase [Nakamurella multipartita]|uniref:Superfamily I DNA and RNA helicase and helicase subunits-like protein n=1 Tax=Nakamurella multipartita (strain ATCC 700099 / DSM 44233 / CIP 104796 / JCM 9543 / NBRC 105858 / Y-104) TaxID=479431 RepID=C8X8G4_NAKMY|nr:AAA family ATPase [Nakamurella multipartita]ACV79019.1 Superfamily I DNA and RNA helicase and helicase subunits-like protein [Nakamurella multipartita DSM 44233]
MAAHEVGMLKRTDAPTSDDPSRSPTSQPARTGSTSRGLIPGSTTAKALYQVWSGTPVTVVKSPPGAGKTALVVDVVRQLLTRAALTVYVVAPNNNQVAALAARLADALPADSVLVLAKKIKPEEVPAAVFAGDSERARHLAAAHVTVCTIARAMVQPPQCDVMVVDESYQSTHQQVRSAMAKADQVLLVGDPGQIGPVVTVRTDLYTGPTAPHLRAPDVFDRHPDAVVLTLPHTYRFGADTAQALAPLYDFGFGSARPPRSIIGLPELASIRVDGVEEGNTDEDLLQAVVRRAVGLVGRVADVDGELLPVTDGDVAVVASHNAQVALLRGMLAEQGHPDLLVGTADKLQGGQWEAVVAVDPLAGGVQGSHATSLGRLCVMASRHKSHLMWVHDGRWDRAVGVDASLSAADRLRAREVRQRLTEPSPAAHLPGHGDRDPAAAESNWSTR